MPEWIIAIAAAVQAVGIVVLVVLTRRYALTVKQQVEQDRRFFNQKAAETAALVERQAKEQEARQRERTEQAIGTIIAELEINSQEGPWKYQECPPLLDSAYAANLWAVHLIGMVPPTFRALGDAYRNISKYNLLYGALTEVGEYEKRKQSATLRAWSSAEIAIEAALKAISQDPATARLLLSGTQVDAEDTVQDGKEKT